MHETAARPGLRFLFGCEEAIGWAVSNVVRDKDGICAALVVAGIAAETKRQGRTIAGRLDGIARRFGLHAAGQFSLELPGGAGTERISRIMTALRSSPPAELPGHLVTEIDDTATGIHRTAGGHEATLELPRGDVLIWRSAERARVVVRPSGTEPKLKIYLQVVLPAGELNDVPATRKTAASELSRLRHDLHAILEPTEREP